MDLRIALADLAHRYQLPPQERLRLRELAGLDSEPRDLKPIGIASIAIFGAALVGLGVIFWIAANWDDIGRIGKFTLLQFLVVVTCAGAIWRPQARQALSVIAILGIGGVFAYFGQTYQTGADPWQLFALWAAMSLPICLGVRRDVTWIPWIFVFGAALLLWLDVHVSRMSVSAVDLPTHLMAWLCALLLRALLSPPFHYWTGAGVWSMRLAALLGIYLVASVSMGAIGGTQAPQFWIGLMILGTGAAAFATPRMFDLVTISAIGLAIDALLIVWLVDRIFDTKPVNQVLAFLAVGMSAAVVLALTVKTILGLFHRHLQRGRA